MVFIDCAIEEVLKVSLKHFWPRLVKGGILVMDHYGLEVSPHESRLIEETIGDNYIRQFPTSRQPTGFVIKEK